MYKVFALIFISQRKGENGRLSSEVVHSLAGGTTETASAFCDLFQRNTTIVCTDKMTRT